MRDTTTNTTGSGTATGQGISRLVDITPTDLVATVSFVTVAAVCLLVVDVASPFLRTAVGLPLLFLAPGYTVVAILFPRAKPLESADEGGVVAQTVPVSDIERLALAFGLSAALLPLFGLAIAALSGGITAPVVVTVVCTFVYSGVFVAAMRRFRAPTEDRYRFGLRRRLGGLRRSLFGTGSAVHTAVNLLLVVAMLVALTSVGYALVTPQDAEQYTELQLLTEDDAGEYVAAEYPDHVDSDGNVALTVAVENQEGERTDYTAVVQEQWVADGDVFDRTTLEETDYSVADGETAYGDHNVTPTAESGTVRVAVLLYDGDVPDTPTTDNAYRYGYVWLEIGDDPEALADE
ncbi:DUF1616 domain-containing protein [Salinadaptatus halalkaliphilus]|nr:DUF1616 domain-containing protein [Salinadaptatus halalkaliphilus]